MSCSWKICHLVPLGIQVVDQRPLVGFRRSRSQSALKTEVVACHQGCRPQWPPMNMSVVHSHSPRSPSGSEALSISTVHNSLVMRSVTLVSTSSLLMAKRIWAPTSSTNMRVKSCRLSFPLKLPTPDIREYIHLARKRIVRRGAENVD